MAEKWTKMSSPDWRWMNPNPLLALNHFTVPCSFTVFPFHYLSYLVPLDRLQPYNKKGQQVLLAAPLIESKGVTRATNANAGYHESALAPSKIHRVWISPRLNAVPASCLAMLEKLHLAQAFLRFFQRLVRTAKIG